MREAVFGQRRSISCRKSLISGTAGPERFCEIFLLEVADDPPALGNCRRIGRGFIQGLRTEDVGIQEIRRANYSLRLQRGLIELQEPIEYELCSQIRERVRPAEPLRELQADGFDRILNQPRQTPLQSEVRELGQDL